MQLRMSDLRLGDTVNCFDGSFGTGIVKQITENSVIVFRPYGTCADFSMSSGVICYTEIEEIPYLKSSAYSEAFASIPLVAIPTPINGLIEKLGYSHAARGHGERIKPISALKRKG